jgi:hypothetical protein
VPLKGGKLDEDGLHKTIIPDLCLYASYVWMFSQYRPG